MGEFANGDRLGAWVIVRPEVLTSMSRLYQAHPSDAPGPLCILKILGAVTDALDRTRHLREIERLRQLTHPHIVGFVDGGVHEGTAFLVMERIDGHPLTTLCAQPPAAEPLVRSVVRQLAQALHHAHAAQVAHRDVKPDNVLVEPTGRVVLTDFGAAVHDAEQRLTEVGSLSPGTPAYAPPEWFTGPLVDGFAADAYALGVLLFELCVGRRAFADLDVRQMAERKQAGPLSLPEGSSLSPWVRRLTAPDPGDRAPLTDLLDALGDGPLVPLMATSTMPADHGAEASDQPERAPRPQHATVGRYEVVGELGRGGMGVVYRAFDPELQRDVALKVTTGVGGSLGRVRREARAVARLQHPNIVRMLDVGPHDGGLYLAMELVDGSDLGAVLAQRGALSIGVALSIVVEVGDALSHAHAKGIVHRDVKPANVLLDRNGGAHLSDFGLAVELQREAARLTRQGQLQGTPLYMAPEQARGDRTAMGPRTDVYALGALLFELVSGRPAVSGEHPAQILQSILSMDEPPSLRAVVPTAPVELENLCRKAMQPDPAHRYPSMRHLVADLRRMQRGEPIQGAPNTLRRRIGWWLHRHRRLVRGMTAALGGAALIAVVVWGVQQGARASIEGRAAARLEGLRQTIADHLSRGEREAAADAFQAFLEVRENHGTSAIASAWLDRARRHAADGEDEEERRALAHAYAEASEEEQQGEALLALLAAQDERWRFRDLDATWRVLQERLPQVASEPSAQAFKWRLDVARRAFPAPGSAPDADTRAVASLVQALSSARPVQDESLKSERWPLLFHWDADSDGVEELMWAASEELRQLGPDLQVIRRIEWPEGVWPFRVQSVQVDGEPHLLINRRDSFCLTRLDGSELQVRGCFERPDAYFHAAAADLDDDGADEIYLASTHYRRMLLLERGPAGVWQLSEARGSLQHANSEVNGVIPRDLDGDGREELVVTTGAWGAYDLRVMRRAADGSLETVARDKLGHLRHTSVWPRSDGYDVITVKLDAYPSVRDFPAEAPFGAPAGLYRHRFEGGELRRRSFLPIGTPGGILGRHEPLDLDGDGVMELAISVNEELWVVRQLPSGGLAGVVVSGLITMAAHDLDGDGDHELVVQDEQRRRWILGMGEARLPVLDFTDSADLGPPPTGWLAEESRRTDDLFAMGFAREGADVLAQAAKLTTVRSDAAAARLRAARYLESSGELHAARELYDQAAEAPEWQREASWGAARCAEEVHDVALAIARYETLRPLVSDAQRGRVDVRLAELRERAAAPSVRLSFVDDLPADTFSTIAARAVRLSPESKSLEVDTTGGMLARVPLRATGPSLSLQVTGELQHLEWSGGMGFMLRDADGRDHLGFTLRGHGGGGRLTTQLSTWAGDGPYGFLTGTRGPLLGPFRIRVDWSPDEGRAVVDVEGLATVLSRRDVPPGRAPEDLELVVFGLSGAGVTPRVRARVTEIVVGGAERVAPRRDPLQAAAEHLVAGDPATALQLLEDRRVRTPRAHELRVLALADLGRWDELQPSLRALQTAAHDRWLRGVVRTGPRGLHAPIARALGHRAPELFWKAWQLAAGHTPENADATAVLTDGTLGTMSLQGAPNDVAAEILLARGVAWRRRGKLALAKEVLIEAERRVPPDASDTRGRIGVERGRVALLNGEPSMAMEHLERALSLAPAPEVLADRLSVDASFAQLWRTPAWSEVVERARRLSGG